MKSIAELGAIREEKYAEIALRQDKTKKPDDVKAHILVCGGTGCQSSGSVEIKEKFEEELKKQNLTEGVSVILTGCFGLCA